MAETLAAEQPLPRRTACALVHHPLAGPPSWREGTPRPGRAGERHDFTDINVEREGPMVSTGFSS